MTPNLQKIKNCLIFYFWNWSPQFSHFPTKCWIHLTFHLGKVSIRKWEMVLFFLWPPCILNTDLPNPHRKINGHFAPLCKGTEEMVIQARPSLSIYSCLFEIDHPPKIKSSHGAKLQWNKTVSSLSQLELICFLWSLGVDITPPNFRVPTYDRLFYWELQMR